MNLGSANVVVRPRAVRESLDLSFPFLLRLGGTRYLRFAASILLPAYAVCLGLAMLFELSWASVWLLAVPLALWLQGLFTMAAGELMFSAELEPRALLRRFARRGLSYTGAMCLAGATAGALSLTLVMAPWACTRTLYVPEASLLEGAPARRVFARASQLGGSEGSFELLVWWVLIMAFGVIGGDNVGHGILTQLLQVELGAGDLANDYGSAYALAGFFAALPVATTFRFLRYIDVRTQSDGWDVQIKLQRVAASAEAKGALREVA